ncbi:liprin-beta-1-like isoform X4 [Clytia hemisphaerica]|uniref:liprin-beta-1-like isoform X4 n=1 Tax=Clytia hemisphaerica TaxID=252671 RepID=UPI0034D57452
MTKKNEPPLYPFNKVHTDLNNELTSTKLLHTQLTETQAELVKTKKSLVDYARKNEELLVRITEQRLAQEKTEKANHSDLLLPDEDNREMDQLKNRIDTLLDEQEKKRPQEDSLSGLKARLREKASECSRLKIQLEDMRQQQEAKDNTMIKIQEQIQRLFEENELLRQQLASATAMHSNGSTPHIATPRITNGMVPQTPESVRSASVQKSKSKEILQMKSGLKSASEPNLIRDGNRSIGLVSPPSLSVNGDEAIYRPFRQLISDQPFTTWSLDQVQDWMRDEGLEEYANNCSKCIKNGEDLIKFTSADFEKSLGISDPMIRKKLNLALKAITSNSPDYAGRLDHNWVARWLDDLGLPQYKQNFYIHKVDGRVLVNMTLDDILQLKVFNLLHHASLKRAVQFLRHQKFHPQFLREVANQSEERCDHVMLWTNQRIMHWLRSVDLAEYAPNLRGSGVHGGLMVLEPRFNAETLANLLSIPNNKSLLRRHVATQFMTLLGDACQRQKEMTAKTADFVPLNGSEKHKLRKKGGLNFGTLRRRKSETDLETLICPMELDVSNIYSPPPALDPDNMFDLSENTSLSPSFTNDNASNSTNDTSCTGPRIAELSQEIDQMTSMLGSDDNQ